MRYESLLARRYMRAQKRQSVFTVVSIATAIAVMTMIFVLYGVLMENGRAASYLEAPYHLVIFNWPENKATALRNEDYVKSVSFERAEEEGCLIAKITFKKGLDDPKTWLAAVADKYGVETRRHITETDGSGWSERDEYYYEFNTALMGFDGIGSDSIVEAFMIFGLFFIFALIFATALRLVVDTSFEISSKERERHYGVLQSIGATPRQIVGIITREGLRLCMLAIPVGLALGVLFAFGMYRAILAAGLSELMDSDAPGAYQVRFLVQPGMLLVSAVVGIVWTFFSAYGVGTRVVRNTPMDAITARGEQVTKIRRRTLSGLIFGLPGRIASRNARRQKKRFRTTVLTLTVSITLFSVFSSLASSLETSLLAAVKGDSGEGEDFCVASSAASDAVETERLLQDSGLFHEVRAFVEITVEYPGRDAAPDQLGWVQGIIFVNPAGYQKILGANPPVSYEELAADDSFVYTPFRAEAFNDSDGNCRISDAAMEEISTQHQRMLADAEAGKVTLNSYAHVETQPEEDSQTPDYLDTSVLVRRGPSRALTVRAVARDLPRYDFDSCLIGTIETYQKLMADWFISDENSDAYGDRVWYYLLVGEELGYSREAYQKINAFFRAHADQLEVCGDSYRDGLATQNVMAVVRIVVLILNCIIALAALINLLNIISTGIANRRSELASLQCVGMTDGQLLRMTLVECLQYVLKAALASALFCGLLILGFQKLFLPWIIEQGAIEVVIATFRTENADWFFDLVRLDVVEIYVKLILSSAVAFAAGCAASVLMLRSQSKQTLSARVRSTE